MPRLTDDLDEQERLEAQAWRLWPDNAYLREEWMRAIAIVRQTRRGWLLDLPHPVPSTQRRMRVIRIASGAP